MKLPESGLESGGKSGVDRPRRLSAKVFAIAGALALTLAAVLGKCEELEPVSSGPAVPERREPASEPVAKRDLSGPRVPEPRTLSHDATESVFVVVPLEERKYDWANPIPNYLAPYQPCYKEVGLAKGDVESFFCPYVPDPNRPYDPALNDDESNIDWLARCDDFLDRQDDYKDPEFVIDGGVDSLVLEALESLSRTLNANNKDLEDEAFWILFDKELRATCPRIDEVLDRLGASGVEVLSYDGNSNEPDWWSEDISGESYEHYLQNRLRKAMAVDGLIRIAHDFDLSLGADFEAAYDRLFSKGKALPFTQLEFEGVYVEWLYKRIGMKQMTYAGEDVSGGGDVWNTASLAADLEPINAKLDFLERLASMVDPDGGLKTALIALRVQHDVILANTQGFAEDTFDDMR